MRMFAALIPPTTVAEDLAAVVRSVPGSARELEAVPADLVHLPLGNFGNVGLSDRMALQEALEEEVARWAPMELRFRGGTALVAPGDDAVWAELDGDVEQLAAMGSVIPRVVQRLGFLIDRRTFSTRIRVGRITEQTSVGFLERLLDRLGAYSGPAWTSHDVSLLRHRSGEDDVVPVLDVLHTFSLVGDADSVDAVPGGRHRGHGSD